ADLLDPAATRELRGIDHPRQIRGIDSAVQNRTGDSETCRGNCAGSAKLEASVAALAEKQTNDFVEGRVVSAYKDRLLQEDQAFGVCGEDGEAAVRAADIAGQDERRGSGRRHPGIFLQWRSSRAMISSASAGPHEPAA